MRVGLLTQWFDPEPGPAALPGTLARQLAARGHQVQVLTGFPNYPTGRLADGYRMQRRLDETMDGVDVRRVALYPSHNASAVSRMANYASFGASALASGLGALRHLDALWVNYSPITVAWPMWAARYGFRVPTVVHVLDLWPDTLLASGFAGHGRLGGAAQAALSRWCDAMYRAADEVAYISPGVGPILQERGVAADKLHYVPMWADESVFRPEHDSRRASLGLPDDAVVLLYAGAMGEAQGLSTLLQACSLVRDPRFVCLLAGSGISESALRAQADELGLTNARFLGRVDQREMTSLMGAADLSYVSLRAHALSPVTMPSKTQAALASGTAMLVAAQGDVAELVTSSGTGFTADPADARSIAAAIEQACALGREALQEMGTRARKHYVDHFSAEQGSQSIEALLERAAMRRARG